jgi:hypothetical protein
MTFHNVALPKIQHISLADALGKSVRIGGFFDTSTFRAFSEKLQPFERKEERSF